MRPSLKDLQALTVVALKEQLTNRGLPKTGVKAVLVERLDSYYTNKEAQSGKKRAREDDKETEKKTKCSKTQGLVDKNMISQPTYFDDSRALIGSSKSSTVKLSNEKPSINALERLFGKYKDDNVPDKIMSDGVIQLLSDLNLEPTSRKVLLLAWKFGAKVQCEFTKEEFYNGMNLLSCDSISKLRNRLPDVEKEIDSNQEKFKEFYAFTFGYAKSNSTQKGLDVQTAVGYWNIVLKDKFQFLDIWNTYLAENYKKDIQKDAWNMLFDFATLIDENMSNYEDEEFQAMPMLLDDFVEYAKPLLAEN